MATNDTYASNQATDASQRDAADRLARVHGAVELHAALLALLLPPGSKRAAHAWGVETATSQGVEGLREQVASLSGAARLPWFEVLLARMGRQPIAARKALLQATRRLISARGGAVRPIDRLHWLVMRRGLGELPPLAARAETGVDVAEWLETDVLALAVYTAFLSRMIPGETGDGPKWYLTVMSAWQPFADTPECEPPDAEDTGNALIRLQTLSWMQRPVVVRNWVAAAIRMTPAGRLDDLAADALRLSC